MSKIKSVFILLSVVAYLLPTTIAMAVETPQQLKQQSEQLVRQKRTIISGIRSWWNGDSTSTTTERPDIDEYSYRDAPAFYGYNVAQELPIAYSPEMMNELPVADEDLGRLAKDLGIKNLQNLPRIEEVMGIMGTKSKRETIDAIREFAQTPGGLEVIESFLSGDDDDDTDAGEDDAGNADEEVTLDNEGTLDTNDQLETDDAEPIDNNSIDVPEEVMVFSESSPDGVIIDNSDRRGFERQMSVQSQSSPLPTAAMLTMSSPGIQSTKPRFDPDQDRENTNNDILKNVSMQPSGGFFQRIGYYMGMLNPFAGTRSIDVPTPTDEVEMVTVMPPKYIYPDGYDPVTKTFTKNIPVKNAGDTQNAVQTTGVRFIRPSLVHIPNGDVQKVLGEKTSGTVGAPTQLVSPYPFINTPIPAFMYQSGINSPLVNGKYQPVQQSGSQAGSNQPKQYPTYPGIGVSVPVVPFRVDLNDEEFNPDQINALREQLYRQRLQEVKNLGILRGPYVHPQFVYGAAHPSFSLAPASGVPINVPLSSIQQQGRVPGYLVPAYPPQQFPTYPEQVSSASGLRPTLDNEPGASVVHHSMFQPIEPEQSLEKEAGSLIESGSKPVPVETEDGAKVEEDPTLSRVDNEVESEDERDEDLREANLESLETKPDENLLVTDKLGEEAVDTSKSDATDTIIPDSLDSLNTELQDSSKTEDPKEPVEQGEQAEQTSNTSGLPEQDPTNPSTEEPKEVSSTSFTPVLDLTVSTEPQEVLPEVKETTESLTPTSTTTTTSTSTPSKPVTIDIRSKQLASLHLSPVPVYSSRGKSITRLSPVNVLESGRPMRLSTPDFEPGAVYKTDPDALESAINAVKVLPPPQKNQPIGDDFQKMFSEVTKLTMQSLEEEADTVEDN